MHFSTLFIDFSAFKGDIYVHKWQKYRKQSDSVQVKVIHCLSRLSIISSMSNIPAEWDHVN